MKRLTACLAVLCALALAQPAMAKSKSEKAQSIVKESREVISEIMEIPEKGISRDLLRRCAGVAIFPGVVKAGLVVGGKYGRGVILRHDPKTNRWSAPAFYSIGAGSVGWQIGAQSTDLILVIMSKRGLKALVRSEFTLGGDASVAAGPVGRKAQAGVDIGLKSGVYAYSRSRGLFAGISLEGAKLNSLEEFNQAYYGKALNAGDILLKGKAKAPKSARQLMAKMRQYAKKKKK